MPAKNVSEYIDGFPEVTQKILRKLRRLIKQTAPRATEAISYGIPMLKLNGKMLIYFAGFKHHVSIYPIPPGPAAFQKAIAPYVAGRGTLRFSLEEPLPENIIKNTVKYHLRRIK
jgi:uncharacterized protein YdhG (YjbR/CyaY superfamily)